MFSKQLTNVYRPRRASLRAEPIVVGTVHTTQCYQTIVPNSDQHIQLQQVCLMNCCGQLICVAIPSPSVRQLPFPLSQPLRLFVTPQQNVFLMLNESTCSCEEWETSLWFIC